MSAHLSDVFNPSAQKIVNYTELADMLPAAYKGKLTLKERVYLNTLDPVMTATAVARLHLDMMGKLGDDLRARNPDGTIGIYDDTVGARQYFSTETLKVFAQYDIRFSLNKEFSRKAWKIMEGLVNAAPDCSESEQVARARRKFDR